MDPNDANIHSVRTELLHDKSNVHITVVQMPAVDTPQFSWVRSRLPNHPQPVPLSYQPEAVARGVVVAADHPQRKQHWVGASTVATIAANMFVRGQHVRRCVAGPLPGPHRVRLPVERRHQRTRPAGRTNCGTQWTVRTAMTTVPTASLTLGHPTGRRNCGTPSMPA